MNEARRIMPGGVSSPVRAFKSVGGNPVVFDRVKGNKAYDVDGNEYVDYVGTWGPAIVGHADERVLDALKDTLDKGTSFGAPCALENQLAKMVIDAVPSVEMVRFTNSGTEACMGVLRLMRAYTGREKVIKFDGCYHGHADSFLVAAGSGVATLGLPDSPGVTNGASASTLVATYNDLASVEALFEANKGEVQHRHDSAPARPASPPLPARHAWLAPPLGPLGRSPASSSRAWWATLASSCPTRPSSPGCASCANETYCDACSGDMII